MRQSFAERDIVYNTQLTYLISKNHFIHDKLWPIMHRNSFAEIRYYESSHYEKPYIQALSQVDSTLVYLLCKAIKGRFISIN